METSLKDGAYHELCDTSGFEQFLICIPVETEFAAKTLKESIVKMIHIMAESREVFIRYEPTACLDKTLNGDNWKMRARFAVRFLGHGKAGITKPEPYGDIGLTGFGLAPISKEKS